MKEDSNILKQLVKAKESIKRKYSALKTGEANVQQLMNQTFKPIIDPLTKIASTRDLNTTEKKKIINFEIINNDDEDEIEN